MQHAGAYLQPLAEAALRPRCIGCTARLVAVSDQLARGPLRLEDLSEIRRPGTGTSVPAARQARRVLRGRDKLAPAARATPVDGNAVTQLGVLGASSDKWPVRRFRCVAPLVLSFKARRRLTWI